MVTARKRARSPPSPATHSRTRRVPTKTRSASLPADTPGQRASRYALQVIALCGWPIEDHRGGPGKTAYTPIDGRGHYDIGYDSIRARDVDNLFACGRLTSADDDAYASLRVQGTAFATGHGAGIAAALLAATGHPDTGSVQKELRRQHAMI